jgi:tetratricopeptide (TPR) repeat protein
MADPPVRRPSTRPPPIPRAASHPAAPQAAGTTPGGNAAPSAPSPAKTESWFAGDEDTHGIAAPDPGRLVEAMLDLVAAEAEALLGGNDAKLADLNVRTALASWDALDQPEEALRFLELAEAHPLVPRLRLAASLEKGTVEDLAAVEEKLRNFPALAIELAEAFLWRHGRIDRAVAICDRLLAGELPPTWRAQVADLALLAHAAAGTWPRVVELAKSRITATSAPEETAAAAALVLDRSGDAAGALALAWAKLEHFPGGSQGAAPDKDALGWLRCFDVAIDAATVLDDARRFDLLDQRGRVIAALPGGALEALATRHAVASELERDGQHREAAAMWTALAEEVIAQSPGAARRVALLRAGWSAFGSAPPDHATALAAHRRLADSDCSEVAATHAWRALEIAVLANDPAVGDLARAVADASESAVAERWLDQIELAAPNSSTIARFEARGGWFVRWAAAIAERLGNKSKALQLWHRAADDSTLPTTRDHHVRLHRGGEKADDRDALAEAYGTWARSEPDPKCAAALWSARGIVDLVRGNFIEAEESLRRAADLAPEDPFCRAALAAVYRADERFDQLARVLAELSTSLTSAEARAAVAREHAELLDEHLGDATTARAVLEKMIADRPDDADAMLVLAKMCERDALWARALELRRKAADLVSTPGRRAEIWMDIARGEEHRGDREAAMAALEKAAEGDPGGAVTGALREMARVQRQAGRLDEALAIVRRELASDPQLTRRVQLQMEIAAILTELDREPEAVVAAYLDVLEAEHAHVEALAGIEGPARKLELWDELARAFRAAPSTPKNLEVLADALAHIAEWTELAEVRRKQLEAAATAPEKAARAAELARLYEKELGDLDGAIRMLSMAQAAQYDDVRQQELLRMLRSGERWPEIAVALERELPAVPSLNVDRQLSILLELAELRSQRLARPADAIAAYESVLERVPTHPKAIAALETLYESLGRDRELARILDTRAELEPDLVKRAQLYSRVAQIRSNRGDVDGSLAAYAAAFEADPTNRDVFTAMERVCYKAERWPMAMQLYSDAIAHVESGKSRAYRLGDLYSRRGNVQLNFLGQVDEAVASYQKVIEVDSQPAAAVKALEEVCQRRGDFKPLIDAWERRAETQKEPARRTEALRAAAALSAKHQDLRQSMRFNKKLLSIDPTDSRVAVALERFYEDTQDRSGLVEVLKMRLDSSSGDQSIEILKRIAQVSEEGARDVDAATSGYKKVLELDPENREALDALGRIYESTEQWAEFIEVTRKQIKVTTDRTTKALLYFRCGSVMEAKFGREQDAIRYYEAAIKTSSACLPAVHGLRVLYRRREEWQKVIETLELEVKLWQDDKERAGVFAQIGRIYEKQLADSERAIHYYESALEIDADCLPANQSLFDHFFDQGAWDRAQNIANALAQKAMRDGDPAQRSDFYRKRGVVARMTGDPRGAAESIIVALEIKPTNTAALDDLTALAREQPEVWDFEATYRELDKIYKKRDDANVLLARVHVGRASYMERAGDLDGAAELYHQALELAPGDFRVLSALVDFHADMRHWNQAVTAIERFVASAGASPDDRLAARMRRAQIHADGEMDPPRAIAVLRDVIKSDPAHQDAYYLLAQQYFLLSRHQDARAAIDRVIELATAPGQRLEAAALARYYYYKGRILDAAGDARAAAPQYRRAIDYDPGYAPPALVLARRAADGGDQRQAETLLIEAAHAAMAQGGPAAAVPLQRGLARILLSSGDRPAAIEAYRGILNVEPDSASDRVALAEIYAVDDPQRAIGELRKVLDRDIHHAPAYRLLASFYNRLGDIDRATRVLTALDLLGFAEEADRVTSQRLRAVRQHAPYRRMLPAEHRARYLLTPAAREPIAEVFTAFAEELTSIVPPPSFGENMMPAQVVGHQRLLDLAARISAMYETEAELFVGEKVPGFAAVTAFPRRLIVIDRELLEESEASLAYLLGYAYDAIRGGYAALLQLGARGRKEIGNLLRNLITPDGGELSGLAADLVNGANDEQARILEQHAGTPNLDPGGWVDGMLALAKRAGMLAADDFAAAIWMVARLTGEDLKSHDATVALGAVLGGSDLVRFYLSDEYQHLRDILTAPVA